jgi:hypothetical protein
LTRLHLFELEDQGWFPSLIRDAGSSYLAFGARIARHGEALAPKLAEALSRSGEERIVDLCSGGSGPLPAILEVFESANGEDPAGIPAVTLTDLYPNRPAFEAASSNNDRIDAIYDSVDATAVPVGLQGLRTLFSGFHHFRPEDARKILSNAVRDGASIAVFEVVARHPLALVGMLFAPIVAMLALPFLRPFRLGWIPLTYVFPIIPFYIFWDGVVSCLRCYSQDELRRMTESIESPGYEWDIGAIDVPGAPFKGTYLIGTPTAGPSTGG